MIRVKLIALIGFTAVMLLVGLLRARSLGVPWRKTAWPGLTAAALLYLLGSILVAGCYPSTGSVTCHWTTKRGVGMTAIRIFFDTTSASRFADSVVTANGAVCSVESVR